MFEMGTPLPEKLVVYGAPYDRQYIHPEPAQRLALFFYRFFRGNKKTAERFIRNVLCNQALLVVVFGIRYLGHKNYLQVIRHQVHLTVTVHPRAWMDIIDDVFSLRLSQEDIQFEVETLLVYNKTDNILDVPPTVAGMQKIFPNSQTKIFTNGLHAPASPLSEEDVKLWAEAILPLLVTKSTLVV